MKIAQILQNFLLFFYNQYDALIFLADFFPFSLLFWVYTFHLVCKKKKKEKKKEKRKKETKTSFFFFFFFFFVLLLFTEI